MNKLLISVSGAMVALTATSLLLNPAQAQVKEQRNPGHAFQRMSNYKTFNECLMHNLKLHGDQRRASAWCSRQGYTQ